MSRNPDSADADEKGQAEQIVRRLFRETIAQRVRQGFRTGIGDLYWSVSYADRVPALVATEHDEILLIRKYYDEKWFKDLAGQELAKAAQELGDQGRRLLDLAV